MLQSIKRAVRLDSSNAELHSCLVRFELKLVTLRKQTDPAVESPVLIVIEREMKPILRGRTAAQINKEFLAENSHSLPALFEGLCSVESTCTIDDHKGIKISFHYSGPNDVSIRLE